MTTDNHEVTHADLAHELAIERRRNSVQLDQIHAAHDLLLARSAEITRLRQGIVRILNWLPNSRALNQWGQMAERLKALLAELPKPEDPDA